MLRSGSRRSLPSAFQALGPTSKVVSWKWKIFWHSDTTFLLLFSDELTPNLFTVRSSDFTVACVIFLGILRTWQSRHHHHPHCHHPSELPTFLPTFHLRCPYVSPAYTQSLTLTVNCILLLFGIIRRVVAFVGRWKTRCNFSVYLSCVSSHWKQITDFTGAEKALIISIKFVSVCAVEFSSNFSSISISFSAESLRLFALNFYFLSFVNGSSLLTSLMHYRISCIKWS